MITDANILQGTVFHEDIHVEGLQAQADEGNGQVILKLGSEASTMKPKKSKQKPAAHRVIKVNSAQNLHVQKSNIK